LFLVGDQSASGGIRARLYQGTPLGVPHGCAHKLAPFGRGALRLKPQI
jgi:hypothetical protein